MATDGPPWWQVIGGFLLVAGLLLLTMRLLSRWQTRSGGGKMSVLSVTSLGPRRTMECLRYGEEVLVVYRSEGAMILVERKPLDQLESAKTKVEAPWWQRLKRPHDFD